MRYETIPNFWTWRNDSAATSSKGRVAALSAAFQSGNVTPTPLAQRTFDHKAVDDLIKLYNLAFSRMAKRNILVELKSEIRSWMRLHQNDITQAWVALLEVVNRSLEANSSASRFTSVICTGWRIGCNYKQSTGLTGPNSSQNPDYFRHSTDDKQDMIRKCGDMAQAIQQAKNGIAVQGIVDDQDTLKIFMAPEFYFRGQNGAYSPDIVDEIVPRMKTLLGAGWNDWLFVFGTAIASIEDTAHFCYTCSGKVKFVPDPINRGKTIPKCSNQPLVGPQHDVQEGTWGAEVQNVALILHDGESHLVPKEYVSGIDYKGGEVVVHPGTGGQKTLKTLAPQGSHDSRIKSTFNDERMGGCIFNMGGITIGLEVCLDHAHSQALTLGRASRYASIIQLLLIPSYGMSIGTGLYCKNGGVVFNVDGRGHGTTDLQRRGSPRPAGWTLAAGRGNVDIWDRVQLPA